MQTAGAAPPLEPYFSGSSRSGQVKFAAVRQSRPMIGFVEQSAALRGVITDWGGVMTTSILSTVQAWIRADGIDWEKYVEVMRPWVSGAYSGQAGSNPVHLLERGECTSAEFEATFAARLLRVGGGPVSPDGLLSRMFAASKPVPAMYEMVRAARQAGFGTALLSNSWGCDEYPRADFPSLFDTVVISGEIGMRKPEPEIFRHTAATLGLDPEECVFVDDLEANVAAAIDCGMTGVHHTDPATTTATVARLLAVPLQALCDRDSSRDVTETARGTPAGAWMPGCGRERVRDVSATGCGRLGCATSLTWRDGTWRDGTWRGGVSASGQRGPGREHAGHPAQRYQAGTGAAPCLARPRLPVSQGLPA